MPQLQPPQVFMSYSRRDKDVMWRTAFYLRGKGLNVWVDNEKLIPGTPIWEEEIEKAIKAAHAIVVIMSPDSKTSEWVRREITLADDYHKLILPVLVRGDEESSITLRLVTRQHIDLRQNEEAGLSSLSAALSQSLQELQIPLEENSAGVKTEREFLKPKGPGKPDSGTQWNSIFWATVGWAIAGAIGGFMYWTSGDYGDVAGGAIGGAIGGLATATVLLYEHMLSTRKSIIWITLAWALGGTIGWATGEALTEAFGATLGMFIGAAIAVAITSRVERIFPDPKRMLWITLAWAFSGAIGWSISRYFQFGEIGGATGWAIGEAIGWAIGGFVLTWQILKP